MRYFLLNIFLIFCSCYVEGQSLFLANIRCENKLRPVGVQEHFPVFSWELRSKQTGILQTAYRIVVGWDSLSLQSDSGIVWDSKKVNSGASIQVHYKGVALQSAKKYYWKVMAWDNKGNISPWSIISCWQMGLLSPDDWSGAKWIAYEEIQDSMVIAPHMHQIGKKAWGARKNILPMMRRDFMTRKKIKQATVFICGLGQFELSLNGKKIGDHFLDPGWTNYTKHAQYVSFDISKEIKEGANTFGVMLGNGFYYIPGQRYRKMTGAYGLPKMILKAVIEYEDGTVENLTSDQNWKTAISPVIFSSIFGGEDYDASLEQPGWDLPGFNDAGWKPVIATTGPSLLESQLTEPVKVMQRFFPRKASVVKSNTSVFDVGQNFSGIPYIVVNGSKGDTIRIIPGELINDDGTVNQKATGSPSYFTYVLKGGSEERWQPKFTYYGFRYLQVERIAANANATLPMLQSVEGLHIRNSASENGSFHCSNELFNKVNDLIKWAINSNTVSVFTDCPHREKLGWLEESYLVGPSIQYNYDIVNLCRKVIGDMQNAQHADGKIPEIAPEYTAFTPPFDESPEWGSAAIILSWYNYLWYGDQQTLLNAYPMMQSYLKYLDSRDTNYILTHGLGDWYDIGPGKSGFSQRTRAGITATATWYYDLTLMNRIAELLGKKNDAKEYSRLSVLVKNAFNKKFYNSNIGSYDSGGQTANAMALYMGLVENNNRSSVLNALIKNIRDRKNALTAGDIGHRYVLLALQQAGRNDIIFDMNSRSDVPGYGFQLANGATALTESWQAYPSVSNNHLMLGHLMEWFYEGLSGIRQAEGGVAYNKIEIRPQPVGDIKQVAATFHSPYGLIESAWTIRDHAFELKVTIPHNTTADIYLPGDKKPFRRGSGTYILNSTLNP